MFDKGTALFPSKLVGLYVPDFMAVRIRPRRLRRILYAPVHILAGLAGP